VDNPTLPAGVHGDVIRGMYLLQAATPRPSRVQLLGSGAILGEVLKAARILGQEHEIAAGVWSVTSFVEIAREGAEREREWRAEARPKVDSWFEQKLNGSVGPIVAATDYVRALPELVRAFVPDGRRYLTLEPTDSASAIPVPC
jgi:pyruvate dehydrogenase E1 component